MFKQLVTGIVAFVILAGVAVAGPWEDGWAAFKRGDYATAMKLWRPLAEQGDANAQFYLGFMYAMGKGVPQDDAEAVKWSRLAAEQGVADAQFLLGVMYANGQGTSQDYVEAMKWFQLAAAQGHENARKNRDIAAGRMTPDQIAEAERLAREWKSTAERGR